MRLYKCVNAHWEKNVVDHVSSILILQNVQRKAQFAHNHFESSIFLSLYLSLCCSLFFLSIAAKTNFNQLQTLLFGSTLYLFSFCCVECGKEKQICAICCKLHAAI